MSKLMIVEVPSYSCEFKGIREVAELVRCQDCKYWSGCKSTMHNNHRCSRAENVDYWTRADDFCSYGSRSEKPNNCKAQIVGKHADVIIIDEPQTETEIAKAIVHKMIDDAVIAEDSYPDLRQKMHDAVDEYEPQTDCDGCQHYADKHTADACYECKRSYTDGYVPQTERSE